MKKRTIKKYGNTFAVKLEVADMKDCKVKEGDELDLETALRKGDVTDE